MNFPTTLITVSTERARARRMGGCGGSLARYKARTNNGHGPATAFPPQKKSGRPNAVQALFVYVRFVLSPAGNKNYQTVRAASGMTKVEWKQLKKKCIVGRQKMAVSKSKHRLFFSSEVCFCSRPLRVFFQLLEWNFWRDWCRGHKQKVLALRFFLVACRQDA
jgi:hypothetical protein